MSLPSPIGPLDAAWLAGLLEGEGTFDHRGAGHRLRIRLSMSDRDVVDRAARLFGRGVSFSAVGNTHEQPMWHTSVGGEDAVEVAHAILPFMGARRSARIAAALPGSTQRDRVSGPLKTPLVD